MLTVVKEKTILLIQLAIDHQVNNLNDKNLSLIYQTVSTLFQRPHTLLRIGDPEVNLDCKKAVQT